MAIDQGYMYVRSDSDYYERGDVMFSNEHVHHAIELFYCESGEKTIYVDKEEYVLKPGDLLFIPPFSTHSCMKNNGGISLCYVMPTTFTDLYEQQVGNLRFENLLYKSSDKTKEIYNHLRKLENGSELIRKGICYYVFGRLIENVKLTDRKIVNEEDFTVRVLTYIDNHYSENITVDKIAKDLGYNRCYFSTLFNEKFFMGFAIFLSNIRIERSISLLGTLPISEVAESVGFNNVQSYYSNFKRALGVTPNEYIKKNPVSQGI